MCFRAVNRNFDEALFRRFTLYFDDMRRLGKFHKNDSMSGLISDDPRTLLVMSRFGITLGFGDKTIDEVCGGHGVDADTFLAVVNMLLAEEGDVGLSDSVFSLGALMEYLRNSHDYFLGFRLPSIRRKLKEALDDGESNLSKAIMNYFDEYVAEVEQHMKYEEDNVFPYVRSLLEGKEKVDYSIDIFRKQHDKVEARLWEFKNILIRYYPAKNSSEINGVLFDIFNCEQELASHNEVEDRLFVPAIMEIEVKNEGRR